MKLLVEVGTCGSMPKMSAFYLTDSLGVSTWEAIETDDQAFQRGVDINLARQTFAWHPPCIGHGDWCEDTYRAMLNPGCKELTVSGALWSKVEAMEDKLRNREGLRHEKMFVVVMGGGTYERSKKMMGF